jgi:hypothetical protein
MLQSFDPNSHVTTRNLSYGRDRNNLRVTVLHLPKTKVAGSKGEDVYWASQDGDTDPTAALQDHVRINQPREHRNSSPTKPNRPHANRSPRQNSSKGWAKLRARPVWSLKAKGRREGDYFLVYLHCSLHSNCSDLTRDFDPLHHAPPRAESVRQPACTHVKVSVASSSVVLLDWVPRLTRRVVDS